MQRTAKSSFHLLFFPIIRLPCKGAGAASSCTPGQSLAAKADVLTEASSGDGRAFDTGAASEDWFLCQEFIVAFSHCLFSLYVHFIGLQCSRGRQFDQLD